MPLKKRDVILDSTKRETVKEILGDLFDYGPDGRTGGFTAAMIIVVLSILAGILSATFVLAWAAR
jgi:hypothetical protein